MVVWCVGVEIGVAKPILFIPIVMEISNVYIVIDAFFLLTAMCMQSFYLANGLVILYRTGNDIYEGKNPKND